MCALCVCVDSGQPGDGDTASGAQDTDRATAERQTTAETKELDAGQYLYCRLVVLNLQLWSISPDTPVPKITLQNFA